MADDFDTPVDEAREINTTEGKRKLGRHLQSKFAQYKTDRQAIEQQWLINLMQYLGKYDAEFEQRMVPNTSRAYPKLTRVKCVSVESRLMSLTFPASEKNWSIEASPIPSLNADTLTKALQGWYETNQGNQPTQAQLDAMVTEIAAGVADLLATTIDDQLKDVDPYASRDYEALVKKVVGSAVKYGPGVVKGPMAVQQDVASFQLDEHGVPTVVETEAFRPYLEFVSCWQYYPDLSASSFAQMEGEFQRHVFSKHQFSLMAERPDFDGDAIRAFMSGNREGNYTELSYEGTLRSLSANGSSVVPKGSKFEVLEYWGSGSAKHLREAGIKIPENAKETQQFRYSAWVVGEFVIKATLNPLPEGTNIFHKFVFEEDEISLLGSGLPPIMRDSQLGVSNFTRMLVDNAATVCGPSVEVDTSIIDPNQTDLGIRAFQVWRRDGGTAGQRAVMPITFDSHIGELLQGINTFMGFADKETFVSPTAAGDVEGVSGEALRTSSGASMIYGNAALPFKDIVRNFDQFTVSVIHALVAWNRIFSPDRDRLMGDVRPIARGSTSLMAKEMRSYALDNLAQTLTEEERQWIKPKALLVERLKVRDLPVKELLEDDAVVEQRQAQQAQQMQDQMRQQMQMFMAQLENLQADTMKALTQGQKNLDNADVLVFKALLEALRNGSSPEQIAAIAARLTAGRQGGQRQPLAQDPAAAPGGGPPISIQ